MIELNIYLESKEKLVESFQIDNRNVTSIDDARLLVVKNLNRYYHDIKYKINIFTTFDGKKTISVFFENNEFVKREYLLKNLLND
jgi:hypothetical protein